MSFFAELKRRNVFKVGAAYVVVAWLVIQATDILLPTFGAPEWAGQTFTLLLILGFPLAVVLAWAYEVTPTGIKRTKQIPLEDSITNLTGQKLNYLVTLLLVAAVLFLVIDNYFDGSGQGPEATQAASPAIEPLPEGAATEPDEAEQRVLPNSVAVLRLENLSPNDEDEYFAEGLHEEILNQLSKLRNLSVISRTSVLRYAGSDLTIPEIARELHVGAVMEGSVRYANNRVRITLQLIDAETDQHLFSETYDREFDDIFAIESDIAMNVANALEAEYSVAEQQSLERRPTESPAAYALYLRAIATRGGGSWTPESLVDLDRAIGLDPSFALAYGEKALQLASRGRLDPLLEPERARAAVEAAEQALALDPSMASAHAALAGLHAANGRWAEAERAYETAYELNPSDTGVLIAYGSFRRDARQFDEAIRLLERAADLDPNANRAQLGIAYRYARNYDAAAAAFRFNMDLNPSDPAAHGQLAFNEIARGNHEEGLKELQLAEQLGWGSVDTDGQRVSQLAYAYAQLGRQQDVERIYDQFVELDKASPIANSQWALMYLALGDYDRAAQRLQAVVDNPVGASGLGHLLANQYADPVLEQPPFLELRSRMFALP